MLIFKGRQCTVFSSYGFRRLSSDSFTSKQCFYKTKDGFVYLNNNPYRGHICVYKEKSMLLAVNILNLEDYLKGVLYNEASHFWPMEALKAQAVVARSYALYKILHSRGRYDLDNTSSSQVYSGVNAERYRTNKAVDETSGEVLVCDNSVVEAFFHSCCGGRTETASELWKLDLSCLISVEDEYCKDSPHFRWREKIEKGRLLSILHKLGIEGSSLNSFSIKEKDDSGRVRYFEACTEMGCFRVSGKKFREKAGPDIVKSLLIDAIDLLPGYVLFKGRGWGHGVGMCQWGAYGMAKAGMDYKEILTHFYPGASISSVAEISKD